MYWFITFRYTNRNSGHTTWNQEVSEKHPLLWQLEMQEKYEDDGSYEVMFFAEINGDIYNKVKGFIG